MADEDNQVPTQTAQTQAPAQAAQTQAAPAQTLIAQAKEPPASAETKAATASGHAETLLSTRDTGQQTAPAGPPEKYNDFNMPQGFEKFSDERLAEVHNLFRENGLSQDQAQKFVDFYTKEVGSVANRHTDAWNNVNKEWRDALRADKEIGSGNDSIIKPEVSAGLARLIDRHLGGDAFRSAMEITGAGNHPDVIRGLHKVAQMLNEGTHVEGQPSREASPRRSIAQRMYPTLVKET